MKSFPVNFPRWEKSLGVSYSNHYWITVLTYWKCPVMSLKASEMKNNCTPFNELQQILINITEVTDQNEIQHLVAPSLSHPLVNCNTCEGTQLCLFKDLGSEKPHGESVAKKREHPRVMTPDLLLNLSQSTSIKENYFDYQTNVFRWALSIGFQCQ